MLKNDVPELNDDCPHRLALANKKIIELEEKAAKWNLLRVTAHRFDVGLTEVIMFIDEKIRNRRR